MVMMTVWSCVAGGGGLLQNDAVNQLVASEWQPHSLALRLNLKHTHHCCPLLEMFNSFVVATSTRALGGRLGGLECSLLRMAGFKELKFAFDFCMSIPIPQPCLVLSVGLPLYLSRLGLHLHRLAGRAV
ncbi:unnamed protein product [Boreogadus saida]